MIEGHKVLNEYEAPKKVSNRIALGTSRFFGGIQLEEGFSKKIPKYTNELSIEGIC